jgi:hypothetical protein
MNNFLDPIHEEEIKEETKEENRLNTPPPPEKKTDPIDLLVESIEKKQKNGMQEYHFRPVRIDGVYCYIVLYLKHNILTVESIHIKCDYGQDRMLPYVLYHYSYSSIKKAVLHVQKIHSSYQLINGDLVSPTNYNDMKLEESILPYSANEVCCVCLDNTTDTTSCGHYICFACRDKCCIQQKLDCPMCRKSNVLPVYHNVMNLINNTDYSELFILFKNKLPTPYRLEPESESESDEDEEDNDNESEFEEEQDEREVDSIS